MTITPTRLTTKNRNEHQYNHRLSGPDLVTIALGEVDTRVGNNKYGKTLNADNGVDTDIWDGANSTDNVDIWVPPTQARIHNLSSTDAADTAAGTGTRTIRIWGLTDWDVDEVSEDITMDGLSDVATVNSYVIIHRMKQLTAGSGGINAGDIKATAQTDSTLTAMITVGEGQTLMAILGVPSVRRVAILNYYASAIKASTSLSVDISLRINETPDINLAAFLTKHNIGLATEGSSHVKQTFDFPFSFSGPAIIKVQANSTSNNTIVSGGFDYVSVTI